MKEATDLSLPLLPTLLSLGLAAIGRLGLLGGGTGGVEEPEADGVTDSDCEGVRSSEQIALTCSQSLSRTRVSVLSSPSSSDKSGVFNSLRIESDDLSYSLLTVFGGGGGGSSAGVDAAWLKSADISTLQSVT